MSIPESLTVDIEGAEAGTQFLAGDVTLPDGAMLVTDPEALVVAVQLAPDRGRGRGARPKQAEAEAGVVRDEPHRAARRLIVAAETFLVVGLGNPGQAVRRQPAQRRRDGGRRAGRAGSTAGSRATRPAPTSSRPGSPAPRVVLAKPRSYMNLSGGPTAALARFFSVDPDHVIAVHDELDLPPATIRVKSGGGEGGHNGLRSISAARWAPRTTCGCGSASAGRRAGWTRRTSCCGTSPPPSARSSTSTWSTPPTPSSC